MDATRRPKKAAPSFDVARADVGGQRDAWVYRSDAPPAPQAPARTAVAPAEPPAAPRAGTSTPPPEPTRSRLGWIGTGVGLMVLPVALTMVAMIAPVLWIAGSRPRR